MEKIMKMYDNSIRHGNMVIEECSDTDLYTRETEPTPLAIAALDLKETVLKNIFSDGNYLDFHRNLCYIYEVRAMFDISEEKYDKAMENLRIMIDHARKYTELCDGEFHRYTCGISIL